MGVNRREFLSASLAGLAAGGHFSVASWGQAATRDGEENPFLTENFAPVRDEIAVDNLPVIGRLPDDLQGMFVRNGPNPQFPPRDRHHWFEGDGMLHGVHIRDGKASYRNRWVRTAAWEEEHEAGKAVYPSVLDPPDLGHLTGKILSGEMPFPNRANTALVWHHDKLLALWEGGRPHEIRLPTLDTVGEYDFAGNLKHPFTAHPKVDPRTGELIFFGYWPMTGGLQYSVADRTGAITHSTPVRLPRPVMMHDVAITEHHTVFMDAPLVFEPTGALRGEPFFSWQPEHGTRIGVLPRHGSGDDVRWFDVQTCFVFHVFNACEVGDELHLYACRFDKYPRFVDVSTPKTSGNLEQLAEEARPIAFRWRCNLATGQVWEEALDELTCEFPRIDERRTGLPAQLGYAISGDMQSTGLVKYDFQSGTNERHDVGAERVAGEGVFVPRAGSQAEDDGYLVSLLYDRSRNRSELLVVDCRSFADEPVARVQLPRRVPYGFHGIWLSERA